MNNTYNHVHVLLTRDANSHTATLQGYNESGNFLARYHGFDDDQLLSSTKV